MLGQLCVIKFQNLSNLCIEHVQKHQIETVVSTLKPIKMNIQSIMCIYIEDNDIYYMEFKK